MDETITEIITKPMQELGMVILANTMHGMVFNNKPYIQNPFEYLFRFIEAACNSQNYSPNYDLDDIEDKFFLEETIEDINKLQSIGLTIQNFNIELMNNFIPKKREFVKRLIESEMDDTRYSKYFQRKNTYLYNKYFQMDEFTVLKYTHNTLVGTNQPCSFSGLWVLNTELQEKGIPQKSNLCFNNEMIDYFLKKSVDSIEMNGIVYYLMDNDESAFGLKEIVKDGVKIKYIYSISLFHVLDYLKNGLHVESLMILDTSCDDYESFSQISKLEKRIENLNYIKNSRYLLIIYNKYFITLINDFVGHNSIFKKLLFKLINAAVNNSSYINLAKQKVFDFLNLEIQNPESTLNRNLKEKNITEENLQAFINQLVIEILPEVQNIFETDEKIIKLTSHEKILTSELQEEKVKNQKHDRFVEQMNIFSKKDVYGWIEITNERLDIDGEPFIMTRGGIVNKKSRKCKKRKSVFKKKQKKSKKSKKRNNKCLNLQKKVN
jgi:hypothetical protein